MSSNWTRYRLEELGDIVTGKTPPSKVHDAFSYSGTQFVTPRDMDGRRWIDSTERFLSESGVAAVKNSLVPSGSVAVSCIGSDMGKAVLLKVESVTNQQINTLVVDTQKFNPKFVYYVLSTKQDEFKSIAGGSATPILNKGHFGKFEIDLPTKDEQDFLVRCLDSLDSKIENNTQTNQTLEQIAQSIFKSWFVDFDPVKAKIETLAADGSADDAELAAMSVISAKTVDELNSLKASNPEAFNKLAQTAAQFPAAMQDSELGEIPEGWEVKFLGEISTFLNGFAFKSKELTTDAASATHKVFKMGNIRKGGGFNSKGSKDYFDLNSNPKLDRFLIKKGDLLMSMTDMKNNVALLGHTALMPISDEYLVNQRVGLIRKSESHYLDFPFLYYQTNETSFITSVRSRANSGVQVNLSTEGIKETPLLVPSRKVHAAFDKQVRAFLEMIFINEKQSVELENVRDLLLPKLLSGEINVTSEVVE